MGCGSFTSDDWMSYTTSRGITKDSTAGSIYTSRTIKPDFDPKDITFRESCDSAEHPNSTPIIIGLDVTGSMSSMLEKVAKKVNVVMEEIYDRQPVTDPQICFMAFGDTTCDYHPLQVTQFESDIRIAEQLSEVYFERGGGGNDGESYTLTWYFAARHTKTDNYEKRGKKGFLFTIGDEPYLDTISKEDIEKFIGDTIQANVLTKEELLAEVSRQYEVYHLVVGDKYYTAEVLDKWQDFLGQRAIRVTDLDKIPEIIVSILEVSAGKDAKEVIESWDGSTAIAVKAAIGDLALATVDDTKELIEF